jgi:hypothetical protein
MRLYSPCAIVGLLPALIFLVLVGRVGPSKEFFNNKEMTMFTAGKILMHNCVPVKLMSLAQVVGEIEFWWCETTFVEHPDTKMCQFNRHIQYKGLHTRSSHVCY